MYRAIPKETICTSIQDETGTIVATGLGIRDRDYVGVYAIHVHPAYRHRHYASSICRTIHFGGIKLQTVTAMAGSFLAKFARSIVMTCVVCWTT